MGLNKKLKTAKDNLAHSEFELKNIIPWVESLYKLKKKGIIDETDFSVGKSFLLSYADTCPPNYCVEYYSEHFLSAIPLLHKAHKAGIFGEGFLHTAIQSTITMRNDLFCAELLYSGLISTEEYAKADKSKVIRLIKEREIPCFGSYTPIRLCLTLVKDYHFTVIQSTIRKLNEKVLLKNGQIVLKIHQRHGLFGGKGKLRIKDNYGKKYTSSTLLANLK